jgi:hypothetical protein
MWMGEGGTIPVMSMLGEKFPQAQFRSPACSARTPTRTGRTSSWISSTRRS